jgi:hypothetical protein
MDRGERVLTICRRVFPVVADVDEQRERKKKKTTREREGEKNECICPSIRNAVMGIEKKRERRKWTFCLMI